jgi:hypothetical protein
MENLQMIGIFIKIPKKIILSVMAIGLVLAAGLWLTSPVRAANPAQEAADASCLECHAKPGQVVTMENGDNLPISIDQKAFEASVHGSSGLKCTACHADITGFPHPARTARTAREYSMQNGPDCKSCHQDKYNLIMDSVHQTALNQGDQNAPVCADCHNPHMQGRLIDKTTKGIIPARRVEIPQTCARCHNGIYETYKNSIHGSALVGEGNLDVPSCVDCHGVHNIGDPLSARFRLKSPQMCAKCHTDASIMSKYNLSTQVLNTYVADFHGTTVTLFEKQTPDQQTNKPVCFDCHGIHDIVKTNDPKMGLQLKQNLLVACIRCHPTVTDTSFTTSWTSHFIPAPDKNPLVFYVNLFYWIMIPGVIGGMALFVLTDIIRRRIDRNKGASHS